MLFIVFFALVGFSLDFLESKPKINPYFSDLFMGFLSRHDNIITKDKWDFSLHMNILRKKLN